MKVFTDLNFLRKTFSRILCMTAGVVLLSVGVFFFKIPNGFVVGGVNGIGTLLGRIFPEFSPAGWIVLLNTILLLMGFIFVGREAGIKTVYCTVLFSALTFVFEIFFPDLKPLTNQPFLELAYATLLCGIGSAMIFSQQASSGGTDIVAMILKKYTRINVGQALLYTDFCITACTFFVFGAETALFSMLGLFAKAFLVDGVIEHINMCKYFVVITTEGCKVSEYIIQELHHGVTEHTVKGSFSGDEKVMIHTVCRRSEALKLKRKITGIDSGAFIIIASTSEILGKGFGSL